MITYFIGCIFFFISNEILTEKPCTPEKIDTNTGRLLESDIQVCNATAEEETGTFVTEFLSEDAGDYEKIVLMLYFALTTLSTVGYGDYHPISDVEMIITSLVMLGGVAFFSYIMGNFIEILSNYDAKMGTQDKTEDLNEWIISLERFTNKTKTNLSVSLVNSIIQNQNYLWDHDRLGCYDEKDKSF